MVATLLAEVHAASIAELSEVLMHLEDCGVGNTHHLGGLVANVVASPLGESVALPLCLAHSAP